MKVISKPSSKFFKVVCSKCKNEQIIFDRAAMNVKCLVCDSGLAESTGNKARIKAKIIQAFD